MQNSFVKGCLLAFIVLSLVGCGGTSQAEGANIPNILHVVRNTVPGYHFANLDVSIHNAAQVQSLYNAAYALKEKAPQGVFHCPFDNGLEYNLDFLRGSNSVQEMQLDATGCQWLDLNATGYDFWGIATTHDRRFTTPSFRTLFMKTLNISSLSPSDG